jgi:5-methyltetrahydrofolate--homocysteine methyltransferase
VPVVAAAAFDEQRAGPAGDARRADYDAIRVRHAAKTKRPPPPDAGRCPGRRARDRLGGVRRPLPAGQPGIHRFIDYDLAELREYIDWTPFFAPGSCGAVPRHPQQPGLGEAARKLYDDAQEMLDRIVAEKWLRANGRHRHLPGRASATTRVVYTDESRTEVRHVLHHLRQQGQHREGIPNRSLADFIAPAEEAWRADHIGAFAVTAGLGRPSGCWRSRPSTTTTTPSCWSPWPTGWPRRSPSGCTSGCAPSSGGMPPRRDARQRRPDRRALPRHPAGPRLSRLPDHTEKQTDLGPARRRGGDRHRVDRVDGDVARGGRQRALLRPPEQRSTSSSAGSVATRSRSMPNARAGPAEAERWLGANLGYHPED